MSVADQTALSSKSPRRIISTVRLSSRVINRVRNLPGIEAAGTNDGQSAAGLLFGSAEQDLLRVEASRAFSAASDSSTPDGMEAAFGRSCTLAKTDPDLTSLQLVGWYSIRPGNVPALSEQDIEFHNRHFRRVTDVAFILNPKQGPNASVDSIHLYSRSSLNSAISSQHHRSGSSVLSSGSQVNTSSDIALRDAVHADHYLKVFQVLDSLDRAEKKEGWKRIALRLKTVTPPTLRPEWMKDQLAHPVHLKPLKSPGPPIETKPKPSPSPGGSTNPVVAKPPVSQARSFQPKLHWLLSIASMALAAGIVLTWLYARPMLSALPGKGLFQLGSADTHLNLQVEPQPGASLLVKWDTRSRAVQSAKKGLIRIDDGQEHHDLAFDSGQVANGSILYTPVSRDLTFRLEVFQADGRSISESMRVVDGTKTPLLAHSLTDPSSASPSELDRVKSRNSRPEASVTVPRERKSNPENKVSRDSAVSSMSANTTPVPKERPGVQQTDTKPQPNTKPLSVARARPDQSVQSSPAGARVTAPSPMSPETAARDSNRAVTSASSAAASTLSSSQPAAIAGMTAPRYSPPRPLKQVMPRLPNSLSSGLYGPSDVEVDVRIDEEGRVTDAHVMNNREDVRGLLTSAALEAAREWTFEPARVHGKSVPSNHVIKFRFHPQTGPQ